MITPSGTLDENINNLIALWPRGLETATGTRWSSIKQSYESGQIETAKKKLVELSKFVLNKSGDMSPPPDDEPRNAAAARLVLYMALYIYNGPNAPIPPYTPTGDNAAGLLTPNAGLTLVTPSTRAGVQFEAGSTLEDRLIVITQNPTPYPDDCTGPLQTTLCQYPLFYFIESFPSTALLKVAKASICHVNAGDFREPLADHDRFRLAHTKPANSADYTPGSTIQDNIEILPLISQSFVHCDDVEAEPPPEPEITLLNKGIHLASVIAKRVGLALIPQSAFAIDQGGGGSFKTFSPFNNVDPDSEQDLMVQAFTASSPVDAGDATTVNYTIKNIGTTTNSLTTATIRLSTDTLIDSSDPVLATINIASILPNQTNGATQSVTIPSAQGDGSYYIGILIDDVTATPDADLGNNTANAPLTVGSPPPILTNRSIGG